MAMEWTRAALRIMAATLLLTLCVGLVGPSLAHAQKKQSAAAWIKKGQDFFDEQEYEQSIQILSPVSLRPDISKSDKIQVYKLLAYNYIVLQKKEEADGAVRGLLVLDENYELPDTESPRFRDFFTSAKKGWIDDRKPGLDKPTTVPTVKITHTGPAQVDKGEAVKLTGEVDDPKTVVGKVTLWYRKGTTGKFKPKRVKYAVRKFSVEIPASVVEPPLIEYYIEAVDENRLPVGYRGDATSPLRIAVPEGESIVSSPWLWVPVGVAVAAAVVVVVVVVTSTSESTVSVNVYE